MTNVSTALVAELPLAEPPDDPLEQAAAITVMATIDSAIAPRPALLDHVALDNLSVMRGHLLQR
jgi:hypothetical protein